MSLSQINDLRNSNMAVISVGRALGADNLDICPGHQNLGAEKF